MNISHTISSLCSPAFIYLIIAASTIMFNYRHLSRTLIYYVIVMLIWTWILNYLCKMGYTTLSWVLLIVPFIAAVIKMK